MRPEASPRVRADLELSAIVLAYRAGQSLPLVLEPLHAELESTGVPYELIVVANYWPGSGDETPRVAEAFARDRPAVRVIAREKEGAMGWDMRAGLAEARGDYMVVIDGDAQNPVADVVRMYRLMAETDVDVMKGRRTQRFDGPYRRVVSFAYNLAFRVLFRTGPLWDINGKPKGLTRKAYERLGLRSDDWFIDAEIVLRARACGLSVAEMPVTFFANEARASLVRPSAIVEFLFNMARARIGGR